MLYVVLVTAPPKKAEALAKKLLAERLIACANIVPKITSLYRWKGKACCDTEALLILKCPKRKLKKLVKRVPELHPYDVPEVLALPVAAAHKPYLAWALGETK